MTHHIIRVEFHAAHAMHLDARWMHRRILQVASRPDTHTLFRAHDFAGTRFTIVTDDDQFGADRWAGISTFLDVRPYAPEVTAGQRRHFTVRLCPVTRTAGRTAKALRDADGLAAFADRLATVNGFELLTYETHWEKGLLIDRNAPALPTVTLDGELEVTDPVAFLQAVRQGVGRAKRFGYGLLLTQPL